MSEDGYTEAEGYAASLRQMAIWIGDEDVPGGEIPDKDELEAAADFIDRQEAELKALRAAAVPQS